jgi:hypothetical protein
METHESLTKAQQSQNPAGHLERFAQEALGLWRCIVHLRKRQIASLEGYEVKLVNL